MNSDIFPYVVECTDCPYGSVAEVTHEEAEEAIPPGIEATPRQAVNRALVLRDWWDKGTGPLCPKCLEDLE